MKVKYISFLPGIAWLIVIYILLTLPGSDIPQSSFFDLVYFDKWVHIGLFATLVFLWCAPFVLKNAGNLRVFLFIVVLAIVYGVMMEFVQKYFTSDRTFDFFDMIADSCGAFIGFFAIRFWIKKRLVSTEKNKPL